MSLLYRLLYIFIFCMPMITIGKALYSQNASETHFAIDSIKAIHDNNKKIVAILNYTASRRKDSGIEVLYKEGLRIIENNPSLAEYEPKLLDSYGVFKRDFSKYADALDFNKRALELARRYKDRKTETSALNNIGVVYRRLDENSTALNYHMEALKLAEKLNDDYSASIALNSIGNIHIALGNNRDAIMYFEKCIPIAKKADNNLGIAMNLNNIGEAYERLLRFDSAKFYYYESLKFNEKINSKRGIAICYNSLGNVYKAQRAYTKSIDLYLQALEINEALGDKIYIANTLNNLGNAYLHTNKYDLALNKFNEAQSISKTIGSKSELRNTYEGLMKVNESLGNYPDALKYSEQFRIIGDSIVAENNNRHVRQMEAIYQSEKEKDKILYLEAKQKSNRFSLIGSLFTFALLLISIVLYFVRKRLLSHNQTLQRELELRSQIASDLHDDMGSSLSSIHIFSELLRKQGGHSNELLNKIEANAKDTLEALDDIIWLVKPSNDKFSNLGVHISEFAIPLFESRDINFNIDFPEEISDLPLPMETRRSIFLIMKESINNLVKYSECSIANINAIHQESKITFTVEDNGKGFDTEQLTERNGLKNIKARAKKIGAEVEIISQIKKGTRIVLTVPILVKVSESKV